MNATEALNRLNELKDKKHLAHSDKTEIEELYYAVYGRNFVRSSCNDCYYDAVIQMYLYLRSKGKMKEKCLYSLKNGALIQMEFGSGEMYTNANLTDEIAERYLEANPEGRVFFSVLPDDWSERVENRKSGNAEKVIEEMTQLFEKGETIESVKSKYKGYMIDGKRIRIRILNAYIKEAQNRLEE